VILIDTNLLVYAHVATFPQHDFKLRRESTSGRRSGQPYLSSSLAISIARAS
jgi:hypothetical protein